MASTTVEWNVGVKGARRWGVTSLIEVEVIEEGNRCFVEWSYPVKLKAKLLAPDIYARLSLQMQNSFRSAAALALYEICVRYMDSPSHLTMRMSWEEWRPTLTGVPDGSSETYMQYKYFKRDVLRPAVEEVNKITDIEVQLLEYKDGRAVSELQFAVRPRTQDTLPLDEQNIFDLSLVTRIVALGFPQGQAEKLYSDYDEGKVRAALEYVDKRLKKSPPLDNPQGYFRKALSAGYGAMAPGELAGEKQKALSAGKSAKPAPNAANITRVLSDAWWSEQRAGARAAFDAKSEVEQAKELSVFVDQALPGRLIKTWKTKGLANPECKAQLARWLTRDLVEPAEGQLLQYGLAKGLISAKV